MARTPESSNDYVRITISYVLAYIGQGWRSGHPRLSIKIYADNDYYSQSSCSTYEDRVRLPKFNNLNKPISEVNKTGLGSSAALITALTGALLSLVGREAIESPGGNRLVHNLAQAAHCAAQGKVGSGFDIAAAVYGSCIYRRFDPELLQPVLLDSIVYTAEFRERLRSVVDSDWEMQITPFTLPSGLRVVMGDVTGGTATPSMVRSVLNWKKHHADASKVWKSLGAANREFISRFADIPVNDQHGVVTQLIQGLHQTNSESDTSLGQTVKDVAACFDVCFLLRPRLMLQKIRGLLRLVGQQASVPIEPPTQTALLDDSLKVNGVSIAGVPGAGGYDAIFCLIADDIRVEANTESTIDRLFAAWKEREVRVCPLLAQNDPSGLLLSSEEEETE